MSASAASEEERESGDARLLSGVAEECDQLPGRGAILTRSGAAMLLAAALCRDSSVCDGTPRAPSV